MTTTREKKIDKTSNYGSKLVLHAEDVSGIQLTIKRHFTNNPAFKKMTSFQVESQKNGELLLKYIADWKQGDQIPSVIVLDNSMEAGGGVIKGLKIARLLTWTADELKAQTTRQVVDNKTWGEEWDKWDSNKTQVGILTTEDLVSLEKNSIDYKKVIQNIILMQ